MRSGQARTARTADTGTEPSRAGLGRVERALSRRIRPPPHHGGSLSDLRREPADAVIPFGALGHLVQKILVRLSREHRWAIRDDLAAGEGFHWYTPTPHCGFPWNVATIRPNAGGLGHYSRLTSVYPSTRPSDARGSGGEHLLLESPGVATVVRSLPGPAKPLGSDGGEGPAQPGIVVGTQQDDVPALSATPAGRASPGRGEIHTSARRYRPGPNRNEPLRTSWTGPRRPRARFWRPGSSGRRTGRRWEMPSQSLRLPRLVSA